MKFPKGTTEHPINKSGKRKILVSVWDFGAVHPQSERSYYIRNDHPAKMRPSLARAILKLYGESPVLDPMAGIGTTLIEAMLLGMNAIGVEYEKRFVNQANKNIKHLQKIHGDKNLGKAICIQGDARNLSCIRNVNTVMFSPPYFNALKKGDGGPCANNKRISYEERVKRFQGYSTNPSNIGNISQFGSIFFSPPYWKAMKSQTSSKEEAMEKYRSSVKHARKVGGKPISKALAISSMGYSTSKENIGNITKFGSIVFSPPYFDALSINKGGGSKASILHEETTKELQMKRSGPFAVKKNLPTPYSSKEENIGNVSEFGSIILSPPYEAALNAAKHVGGIASRDPQLAKMGLYSKSKDNIGNTVGRTYLGEMLKVYKECYRVLKPGKFMVVVIKDIQRNWKTIPLGADTIKLCQLAGFDCHDIIINKMYFPSFWMLNLAKKAQTEGIKEKRKFHALKSHEYILVLRKPLE